MSLIMLCDLLKVSEPIIRQEAKAAGVSLIKHCDCKAQPKVEFIRAHPEMTANELAKGLGISVENIRTLCWKHNLEFKRIIKPNEKRMITGDIFNVHAKINWLV